MFAVFGVDRKTAQNAAVKELPPIQDRAEYERRLTKDTDRMFRRMKPVQLSPFYTSRREAESYVALARKYGADRLEIRERVLNPDESKRTKGGKQKTMWA